MDKNRVEELLTPILSSEGLELVDIEYKKEGGTFFLRVFIDKEDSGVTLGDCQLVNDELGTILDIEDVIPNEYTLEISSPGVERPLKKLGDYKRFAGKKASLKLFKPVDGKKELVGIIEGVEENRVKLVEDKTNSLREIELKDIAKSNLKVW